MGLTRPCITDEQIQKRAKQINQKQLDDFTQMFQNIIDSRDFGIIGEAYEFMRTMLLTAANREEKILLYAQFRAMVRDLKRETAQEPPSLAPQKKKHVPTPRSQSTSGWSTPATVASRNAHGPMTRDGNATVLASALHDIVLTDKSHRQSPDGVMYDIRHNRTCMHKRRGA